MANDFELNSTPVGHGPDAGQQSRIAAARDAVISGLPEEVVNLFRQAKVRPEQVWSNMKNEVATDGIRHLLKSDKAAHEMLHAIGGQGGGQDLPKDDSAKKSFDEFNRDNPGCRDAIDAIAGKKGAFEEAFKNTRWLDARGLSDKEMKNLKLSTFGETGRTKDVSLYDIFVKPKDNFPKEAIAIWTGQPPTVITHYQGIAHPSRVVPHETLHILFKGVHTAIAEKLGLGRYGTDDKADKRATDNINDYLKNNCNVPRR